MKRGLKTIVFGVVSALFAALLFIEWAAPPTRGAAHSRLRDEGGREPAAATTTTQDVNAIFTGARRSATTKSVVLPSPASFRESGGRGLIVRAWINGAGPFDFAVDTGAGANILSERAAAAARVEVEAGGGDILIGGLSGRARGGARKAFVRSVAVGFRENRLPARGLFIVAPGLPPDVDGVLDPSETYAPLGYVIDFPRGRIRAFDPRATPVRAQDAPPEGAVVRWLTDGQTRRPFVMLGEGRRALLDTGSGFGLAVDASAARSLGVAVDARRRDDPVRDLGGGEFFARRVSPATVSIGPLVLRRVPTDLLTRTEKNAPVILGRDALRPFELIFDPANRLIMLRPGED